MDLTIDFGNTRTKVAVFSGNMQIFFQTYDDIKPDDVHVLLEKHPGIRRSILSSVVNHHPDFNNILKQHTRFLEFEADTPLPISIGYKTPFTLGKDRLCAAVAGHSLYPGHNILVIMAGTCLTYDFVDQEGLYHGGAISPGIRMRFNALNRYTDNLPLIEPSREAVITGNTTETSILSGVMNGATGEVNGFIENYQKIYKNLTVILSGGDADYFDKKLKNNIFALPNVVLIGLKFILDFNAS